jgi:hypothetical protein
VKSRATADFWACYDRLPAGAQRRADETYTQFCQNPAHPALRFKALAGRGNRYSVRVSDVYRAVGVKDGDTIIWFWIGTHNQFDNLF